MKTLLLPLFTLTFYFLFSQESNNDFFYLKQDLHKKSSINSNKTEALNSRLIGYCGKMFSSGSWRNFDSAVFVYSGTRGGDFNSQKYPKADTQVSYYWNVNEWGESYKWNVTYDPENRKTEQELLEQSINNWVKLEKTTFNYNFNGDISEDINYLFKNNIYKKNYKNIYNYDAKNRLSTIDCNKWDSITWVDFSRVLYDYDSSDNVNKETTQLLNNGNWVNTKIKLNKYNTANNLIYTQQDSIINGIMTPFFKRNYEFDNAQLLLKISDSVYRFGTWISNINIDYLYDSLGNISTEFENRFNTFTKTTYTYNEFQQQTSMLKQKIMNGNLINDKFYNYYYEQYNDGVGIKMDDIMESSIYPNPFRENVTIDFYLENSEKINLKINDINGRCIYHLSEFFPAGKQSVFWSPESLNTGLYIYTIKSEKSSAVGRLINF